MPNTAYPSHKRIWTRLLPLVVVLMSSPSLAAETLFRVEYNMELAGFSVGRVTRTLSLENGIYHFESDARPTGMMGSLIKKTFHESSRWRLEDGHIRPLEYRYLERSPGHDNVKSNLVFDWPHQAVWDRNHHFICWPLTDNSQDPASASFALMMAAAHHRPTLSVHSIGGNAPLDQHYRWIGSGTFNDRKQKLKVVKYQQTDKGHIRLHAWFAPERAWLPVYIHQEVTDGADTTMTLLHVDTLNAGALLKIWGE